MVDLLQQDLALLDRGPQAGLDPLALDRHAQQVGGALQERDVVLVELAVGLAVDLEHAERLPVTLKDHVHCPPDAISGQQLRRAEPVLVLEVV